MIFLHPTYVSEAHSLTAVDEVRLDSKHRIRPNRPALAVPLRSRSEDTRHVWKTLAFIIQKRKEKKNISSFPKVPPSQQQEVM